ncbi:MAG: bifunctional serine/threonine-protein kinase/formylglycine-generating enzyme family protein [Polyangiales bacterium]
MTEPERKAGTLIAHRYTLERQLGEGAFGEVWTATDSKAFGRRVAVKFLLQQHLNNEEVVRRFQQEGQATAALSHPNVVALLEFGEDAQHVPYLVSEFVEGEPLRKILDRNVEEKKLLSVDEVLAIFRQACAGVLAAHQKKIVHRDLKPENIMVQGLGTPAVVVKVLDFGVARILGKDSQQSLGKTEVGKIIGSLQYMSPEQVLGDVRSIDRRTDIFAMGAVLFELFAQRAAFDGRTYQEVIGKILDPTRPKLATYRPDVGPALDAVFDKAFAMHRDQRYNEITELLEAVELALAPMARPRRSTGLKNPIVVVPDLSGQWGASHDPAVARPSRTSSPDAPTKSSPSPAETTMDEVVPESASPARPWLIFLSVFVVVAVGGSLAGTAIVRRRNAQVANADDAGVVAVAAPEASTQRLSTWTAPPEDPSQWVLVAAPAAPVQLGREGGPPSSDEFTLAAAVRFEGPSFRMMKREVTFGEYEPWSEANGEHRLLIPSWVPSLAEARAALPVVNVAWASAKAYCEAIGGSLPTEEQWEFAGRRTFGRLDPWSGTMPAGAPAMVGRSGRLQPAGSFAGDATAEGILGLATNGAEWTLSTYQRGNGLREPWQQAYRTVRGLSLFDELPRGEAMPASLLRRNAGCATGACTPAERRMLEEVGFRCVKPAT